MTAGDHLVYRADPLEHGIMELLQVRKNGDLTCMRFTDGEIVTFTPHDLDYAPDAVLS